MRPHTWHARLCSPVGACAGAAPLLLDRLPSSGGGGSPSAALGADAGVLTHEHLYLPTDAECLANSEFLAPLDAGTLQLYKDALRCMQEQPAGA